jgi:amino acid transporter
MESWWWHVFGIAAIASVVFLALVPVVSLARNARSLRRERPLGAVRWFHGAWAVVCTALILALVLSPGGHPPALVFAPIVLAAWAIGHRCIRFAAGVLSKARE